METEIKTDTIQGNTFKIGDVVCLNSGGNPMTVKKYDPDSKIVEVAWMFMDKVCHAVFYEQMLFIQKVKLA